MVAPLNILGRRFGLLVAVEEMPKERGMRVWRLRCDCGNERTTLQKNFVYGHLHSCGCTTKRQVKHGLSKTKEYRAWINMQSRCTNPNTPGYASYGGRGISVCDRWMGSFENFLADVGPRPTPNHSIDRIDVNGNYEPNNVRWALPTTQCRNQRDNHKVSVAGNLMTLADAVDMAPVPYNTVLYRLKRGWRVEDAISFPARKGFRPHVS
jgi:hypothetical protein